MAWQCKWQKNTIGLYCWISHSKEILNGIHIAVAYNVTNRKFTSNTDLTASRKAYMELMKTSQIFLSHIVPWVYQGP